jgi:hypothetical protein
MDDLRKKKLKKKLLKQVETKNSFRKFRYKAAACAVIVVISIAAGVGVPVLAKNVSAFKSIIQLINRENKSDHGEYQEYSEVINKSAADKEITFTINEVVCDDSSLMIGYTVKSKGNIKDLMKSGKEIIEMQGKDSNFVPFGLIQYLKINGKRPSSGSGSDGKYLDSHTYVNSETMDIGDKNLPSIFNVDLNITNIYNIKGNWNFKFSISKDEVLKNTKTFKPNTIIKFPDTTIDVKKVSFTPINTIINVTGKYNRQDNKKYEYNQWFIFDDNGDEISEKGISGDEVKNSASSDFEYEYRFVSSKHIPKYLTVIPYKVNYGENNVEVSPIYKNIDGKYPIELSQGKMGKLTIKEIYTDKDKTIVRYTAQGKLPAVQAKELFIINSDEKVVQRKNNDFSIKKDKDNPNLYIMEFESLDKNKKYKIGTNAFSGYEIRDDLKFKIDLSDK